MVPTTVSMLEPRDSDAAITATTTTATRNPAGRSRQAEPTTAAPLSSTTTIPTSSNGLSSVPTSEMRASRTPSGTEVMIRSPTPCSSEGRPGSSSPATSAATSAAPAASRPAAAPCLRVRPETLLRRVIALVVATSP